MTAVLFTCAGQRVDIVSAFGRAGATTVATDLDPLAPALWHADHHAIAPRDRRPRLRRLLCAGSSNEHDVRLIVPLTDLDHVKLVRARDELGALVLLPSEEVVRRVGESIAHLFFEERGIPSPPSWLPDDVPDDARYPLLVKVREGFGSRNIFRARDRAELDFFLRYTAVDSFVQDLLQGRGVLDRRLLRPRRLAVNAIPRTMIQSKGGESIKGMTIQDRDLIEFGARGGRGARPRRSRLRSSASARPTDATRSPT